MEDIFKKITPSENEVKKAREKVEKFLKELNLKNAIPGGSFAKNTWLKGKHDIDIYVKYKDDKNISNKLESSLKKFNYKRIHGSRDYFQIEYQGLIFELVPVQAIKKPEQAKNITDLSQLHVGYVKNHATKDIQNQIRLAKYFFKINNLYGAETHIQGFSGYSIEILIIYYKSLNKFLASAKKWKEKTVIDPVKYYKTKREILLTLNKSKTHSPLILVDPVQKERNVSAALSQRKYQELIALAKLPISFEEKEFTLKKFKNYHIIEATPLEGKKDVVGAKIVKILEKIKYGLNKEGFTVLDYGWHWGDHIHLYFKTKNIIPKTRTHPGPYIAKKEHAEKFAKKHKQTFILKDRICAKIERKHTSAKEFIKELIRDSYVNGRVKTIKYLNSKSQK